MVRRQLQSLVGRALSGWRLTRPTTPTLPFARQVVSGPVDGIEVGGFRLRFYRLPERKSKEALPPPLSLIVRRGPSVSSPLLNVLPGESILIGHCETALWQLAGQHVSRHHCRIQAAGEQWEIQDLRSTNGTQVNGQRIEKQILQDRNEITIGQFIILASLRH